MRCLNKGATRIFECLIDGLKAVGDSKRVANNDSFMPVVVECVNQHKDCMVYSVSHYGEQNGDLMADPDVTFLRTPCGKISPLTFRNDYVGVEQVAVLLRQSGNHEVNEKHQYSLVDFCDGWMQSINDQQELGVV